MKRLLLHLIVALVTFSAGYLLWQAGKCHNSEAKLWAKTNQQEAELRVMQDSEAATKLKQEMQKLGCDAQDSFQTRNQQLTCDTLQSELKELSFKEYLEHHARY